MELTQDDSSKEDDSYKERFIKQELENYPGSDETIIRFIYNFRYFCGKEGVDCVQNIFRNGYCYYFALMLKDAFKKGEMCLASPFGHIVYVQDGIPYDIDGVYDGEAIEFVPVDKIDLEGFRHI